MLSTLFASAAVAGRKRIPGAPVPPPPPPPSGTVLANAAAAMSSGQWLNFSASSGTTGLLNWSNPVASSNSGLRTAFSSKFVRDHSALKAYYYGGDHSEDGRFLVYDEATNAWSLDHSPAFANIGGAATARHSYEHNIWVPTLGKMFTRTMQTLYLQRWDGGTTWTQRNYGSPTYPSSAIGMCWFPELGKIMMYQDENGPNGILVGLDPTSMAVTTYISAGGTLSPAGDPHNFCQYSQKAGGRIFFGGGNSVQTAWVYTAGGSLTPVTLPAPLGDVGPGSAPTLVVLEPVSGNFLLFRTASIWYVFDPVAMTFTAQGSTASMLSSNTYYTDNAFGVIACPISEYGVTAYIKSWARGVAAQMWLHKA